jgi:Tol biopolymer transport system component
LNAEDFDEQAQKLVMLENGGISTVDLATNEKTQIYANSQLIVESVCLSNDGNMVLFTAKRIDRSGTDLFIAPALPSASPFRINQLPTENDVLSACFSPDGAHIAYCANGIIYVTDMTGENRMRVSCDGADCYMDDCSGDRWPAFVDGGQQLMFMSNRHCQDPLDESWSKNWVVCDVMPGAETSATDLSPNTPGFLPAYNDRLLMTTADDGQSFFWIGHNEYGSPFRLYRIPMDGGSPVLLAKDITAPEKYNVVAAVKYIR